jgi:hypothetical protein
VNMVWNGRPNQTVWQASPLGPQGGHKSRGRAKLLAIHHASKRSAVHTLSYTAQPGRVDCGLRDPLRFMHMTGTFLQRELEPRSHSIPHGSGWDLCRWGDIGRAHLGGDKGAGVRDIGRSGASQWRARGAGT